MKENISLFHTATGASIAVDSGAFRIVKLYPTMVAAAREALNLGLISSAQVVLLTGNSTGMPYGLTAFKETIEPESLFQCGFTLGF